MENRFIIILQGILILIPFLDYLKKKEWGMMVTLLVIGFAIIFVQLFKNEKDEKTSTDQVNSIDSLKRRLVEVQNTGNSTNDLTRFNLRLSKQIDTLGHLNNSILTSTKGLVIEGKNLTAQNLDVSRNIQPVIQNVNRLTNKVNNVVDDVFDEVTGGASIPLISAELNEDRLRENQSIGEFLQIHDGAIPTEKWWAILKLKNTGKNALPSVTIDYRHQIGRYHSMAESKRFECPSILQPYQHLEVNRFEICNVLPYTRTEEEPYYPFIEFSEHEITVRWRDKVYTYVFSVPGGTDEMEIKRAYYRYHDIQYDNSFDFLKAITTDLKPQSK